LPQKSARAAGGKANFLYLSRASCASLRLFCFGGSWTNEGHESERRGWIAWDREGHLKKRTQFVAPLCAARRYAQSPAKVRLNLRRVGYGGQEDDAQPRFEKTNPIRPTALWVARLNARDINQAAPSIKEH
jgi:hypothetical protein